MQSDFRVSPIIEIIAMVAVGFLIALQLGWLDGLYMRIPVWLLLIISSAM